jgi:hypothetical protein
MKKKIAEDLKTCKNQQLHCKYEKNDRAIFQLLGCLMTSNDEKQISAAISGQFLFKRWKKETSPASSFLTLHN